MKIRSDVSRLQLTLVSRPGIERASLFCLSIADSRCRCICCSSDCSFLLPPFVSTAEAAAFPILASLPLLRLLPCRKQHLIQAHGEGFLHVGFGNIGHSFCCVNQRIDARCSELDSWNDLQNRSMQVIRRRFQDFMVEDSLSMMAIDRAYIVLDIFEACRIFQKSLFLLIGFQWRKC